MGVILPSLEAISTNRTYLKKDASMAADFDSVIADFKDMKVGSIQVKWSGNDTFDGMVIVEASNVPEEDWFDEVKGGTYILSDDGTRSKRKTKLFNLGVIGFRYARVLYFKGTNTTGTINVIALGKK